jgi:hypothetical protein
MISLDLASGLMKEMGHIPGRLTHVYLCCHVQNSSMALETSNPFGNEDTFSSVNQTEC